MSTPLIQTVELKKYFNTPAGALHAVDNVNISIEKGKTLGVVGESGCGKSTLGRTILRLAEPTSGKILYNGQDIVPYSPQQMLDMRKQMQIIFQDPYASLNPRMTVFEIIAEPIKVCRTLTEHGDIEDKVFGLMETVGLSERFVNAYPHELDGGRRQRIGVARALALDPEFIVCDEPVSALDVSIQAQILNLMMDLQDSMGLTYMFITHDMSVVKHISHEIMVMYLGQCVEYAKTEDLFKNPLHPYTKGLLSSIPVADPKLARQKETSGIEGDLPSPVNPPSGCRFRTRCPYAREICAEVAPCMREVAPGHSLACHLYD